MRICAVTSFPPTVAGVADYGALLVDELSHDARVDALTVLADRVAGASEHECRGRLEIHRAWERDRADTGLMLARAIIRSRPDVVWFNIGLTMFGAGTKAASGMLVPLMTRALGCRSVLTLHELPALADLARLGLDARCGKLAGAACTRLLLGADEVVVTLERYRSYLAAHYGAENVTHIPHGIWEQPERADEPEAETVLVFGTFGPHKDPGVVAHAVALLRSSRPRLRLLVAGADHPRYPGFMARCCARYGLGADWVGYVPREELGSLFAQSTVVVVPADASTGSSGVIHRAVGHGRAVLVSDLPDFRALAQEEDLRFAWFSPRDVADLARALGALLDDRARRNALVAHNLAALAPIGPTSTAGAYLALFARSGRTQMTGWEDARATRPFRVFAK
jgi:glycosyltransferase involved in cell wall biosynthesis